MYLKIYSLEIKVSIKESSQSHTLKRQESYGWNIVFIYLVGNSYGKVLTVPFTIIIIISSHPPIDTPINPPTHRPISTSTHRSRKTPIPPTHSYITVPNGGQIPMDVLTRLYALSKEHSFVADYFLMMGALHTEKFSAVVDTYNIKRAKYCTQVKESYSLLFSG